MRWRRRSCSWPRTRRATSPAACCRWVAATRASSYAPIRSSPDRRVSFNAHAHTNDNNPPLELTVKHIEKGVSLRHAPSDFLRDMNVDNVSTGLVAGILGLSVGGGHISAGAAAGLDSSFIMIWVISYLMINGLFGIFMPAYYRLPMPMANSIPGALMFAAVIPVVGLEAALGATLIAGAISLVAGLAGVMGIVMRLRSEERRVGKECRSGWSLDR